MSATSVRARRLAAVGVPVLLFAVLVGCGQRNAPAPATAEKAIEITIEPEEKIVGCEDPGLDSRIEAAVPGIERLDKASVDAAITKDNLGQPKASDTTALAAPGLNSADFINPGTAGDNGALMQGT